MRRRHRVFDPVPSLGRYFAEAANQATSARTTASRWTLVVATLFIVAFNSFGFLPASYTSSFSLFDLPLLAWGDAPRAWLSIGVAPVGVLSVGAFAVGVIAIGGVAVGVVSIAGVALALLAASGGLALAFYAFGGVSVGGFAYAGQGIACGYYLAQGNQRERLLGNVDPTRPR